MLGLCFMLRGVLRPPGNSYHGGQGRRPSPVWWGRRCFLLGPFDSSLFPAGAPDWPIKRGRHPAFRSLTACVTAAAAAAKPVPLLFWFCCTFSLHQACIWNKVAKTC